MNILLNCFPPSTIYQPDLGLSVLKQYLQQNNIGCDIIYWNILFKKLKEKTIKQDVDNDIVGAMLPFLFQLFPEKAKDIEFALKTRNLFLNTLSTDQYNSFFRKSNHDINRIFDKGILEYNIIEKYTMIGLSYRFLQWIPGLIFISKLKEINPHIKIVMGGFTTRQETIKLMESVNIVDYGIWGEGEVALKQLCEFHFNNKEGYPINVQSLIYKNSDGRYISNNRKIEYTKLVTPDFTDFFRMNKQSKSSLLLPIERSRGCSWRKCMFCYLNEGYKFRRKTNDEVLETMDILIKRHNIKRFNFNDNDLICSDLHDIDSFLDKLIKYKGKKRIEIWSAEINTKHINELIIRKFYKAGFKAFQLGIESLSDSMLLKIKKESLFINHLFAIKMCVKYKIRILGANIIMGFPDDISEDNKVCINNLHYLRYYFSVYFSLRAVPLNIKHSSKYYKQIITGDINAWDAEILPLIDNPKILDNRFYLFDHINKTYSYNSELFLRAYFYYRNNNFKYKICCDNEKRKYNYTEFFNDKEIYTLEFDNIDWEILNICNSQIVTKKDVFLRLNISEKVIIKRIDMLVKERVIYQSDSNDYILSIIDVAI